MEKLIYSIIGLISIGSLYVLYQKLTGSATILAKPKENPNIPELTKKIQENKDKLSKHDDNRSTKDVEDYYSDSSDK